jgi:hypothetical protein
MEDNEKRTWLKPGEQFTGFITITQMNLYAAEGKVLLIKN